LNKRCSNKKLKLLSEFCNNMFLAAMGQYSVTEWTKWENDSLLNVFGLHAFCPFSEQHIFSRNYRQMDKTMRLCLKCFYTQPHSLVHLSIIRGPLIYRTVSLLPRQPHNAISSMHGDIMCIFLLDIKAWSQKPYNKSKCCA